MPFRYNPFTGTLDIVNPVAVGSAVVGPITSTDNAITRWDGTTGTIIQDSLTILQDGGAIEAQGFLTRRSVTALVSIPTGQTWIAPELEIEMSGAIEIELDAELIII